MNKLQYSIELGNAISFYKNIRQRMYFPPLVYYGRGSRVDFYVILKLK